MKKCSHLSSYHVYLLSSGPELFHDGGRYHIETSPLICGAKNQWTGFYVITVSIMKELNYL